MAFVWTFQVDNIPLTDEHRESASHNDDASLTQSKSFETYLQRMLQLGRWGDDIMLACASKLYQRSIHVLIADGSLTKFDHPPQEKQDLNEQELQPLTLGFIRSAGATTPNHYVHLQHRKTEVHPSVDSTRMSV